MKTLLAKTGLMAIVGLFAVSCATKQKDYQVELVDRPELVPQEQETYPHYERYPYFDYRGFN